MNHCLLEVKVKQPPTVRYTQDNKTPIAEMEVLFDGLRADDPPSTIKVVGWGNLAQELQNTVKEQQKLIIEGRLRMSTLPRQDGTKEKKAEFTLSRLHLIGEIAQNPDRNTSPNQIPPKSNSQSNSKQFNNESSTKNDLSWDTSPLVPDTDEIPF
tara:strand:- start:11 stop:475 length:465 start_codon:yes stop_codon:yes gene_type:complete